MIHDGKLLFACFALLFLSGDLALAEDRHSEDAIRGRFRLTANGACTESIGGFTARPFLQPFGNTTVYQEVFSGTATFNGRGGISEAVRGMTMFDGPFFPANSAVGTFAGTCAYTYSMTDELSFKMQGSCSGTLLDGPAAGQSYAATGIQLDGQISRDGDTILLSAVDPVEQEISLSGGYVAKRYCIHTITLIRGVQRP